MEEKQTMRLDHQVCTPDQGKRLANLGITGAPLFWHLSTGEIHYGQHCDAIAPAYTTSELGQMCPYESYTYRFMRNEEPLWIWVIKGKNGAKDILPPFLLFFRTEAIAKANMIISCLNEGKISAKEANKKLNKRY
ncbi:hypothetical protein [Chitinophaga nivalis]|uniref:Uncharacterized protein n=1 Tax=Chitinophaga nivalis TaxID=2991709 RepID=A0ABT3IIK5_9BACT|nr:hypothetical protein [Chitinophaga nivalis]MCW3466541.1 hypothetical protein [Chitinophaga nivalis]MCW3483768.1 hypothetical protein [Chitinophaga nivalis]